MEDWQTNVNFPSDLLPGRSFNIWRDARAFAVSSRQNGVSGKVKFRVICKDEGVELILARSFPLMLKVGRGRRAKTADGPQPQFG